MGGFLALLSLELRWDPGILCLPYPCQLKHGGGAFNCSTAAAHIDKLTPAFRAEIDRLVAADQVPKARSSTGPPPGLLALGP